MRFYLIAIIVIIYGFSAGCEKPVEQAPIPADEMRKILLDMQLAEAFSMGRGDDSLRMNKFKKNTDSLYVYYSSVLKHHNIHFRSFMDALEWYKSHPKAIDSLIAGVIEEMNIQKTEHEVSDVEEESPERKVDTATGPMPFRNAVPIPVPE